VLLVANALLAPLTCDAFVVVQGGGDEAVVGPVAGPRSTNRAPPLAPANPQRPVGISGDSFSHHDLPLGIHEPEDGGVAASLGDHIPPALVHHMMVVAAQQNEVVQFVGPAFGTVHHVVSVQSLAGIAARELTMPMVSPLQLAANPPRNCLRRPGLARHCSGGLDDQGADQPVASQPPRGLGGNAPPVDFTT
jgi:hypothetical protein